MFWNSKAPVYPKVPDQYFPPDVVERIKENYPDLKDQQNVASTLNKLIDELELSGPRIIRCILFASGDDISEFKRCVQVAKDDWRDIIGEAEYENGKHIYNFNEPFAEARMKEGEVFKGPRSKR